MGFLKERVSEKSAGSRGEERRRERDGMREGQERERRGDRFLRSSLSYKGERRVREIKRERKEKKGVGSLPSLRSEDGSLSFLFPLSACPLDHEKERKWVILAQIKTKGRL